MADPRPDADLDLGDEAALRALAQAAVAAVTGDEPIDDATVDGRTARRVRTVVDAIRAARGDG